MTRPLRAQHFFQTSREQYKSSGPPYLLPAVSYELFSSLPDDSGDMANNAGLDNSTRARLTEAPVQTGTFFEKKRLDPPALRELPYAE